ncbi:unnamed protein product [Lactuca virosa]|uniref:TRUD domain-containing protein n=1 Tax=Lactuca virosa TaxID=75947 RepID=A0AAU9N618_9ASTR|nr:unnamed protein product [Lactuca virosa]
MILYSNFIVNQVDLDGNVVHLTSIDAPMETAEEHESKTTKQPNGNHYSEIESFRALVGDSDANSLKEFIDKINSNDEDGVTVTNTSIVLSPSSDKPRAFGFYGTEDKCAVTTQRGVVAYSEDIVKATADAFGKHGFVIYFDMQRFGSSSIPTHLIGAKLLKGEWKEAVSMILDPRDGDILLVSKIII